MAKNKKKPEKSKEQVHQEIKETLGKITRFDPSEINDDLLFREELGIDSLMAMEILAKVENYYKIKIKEEDIINVKTVGEFIDIVDSQTFR